MDERKEECGSIDSHPRTLPKAESARLQHFPIYRVSLQLKTQFSPPIKIDVVSVASLLVLPHTDF